MDFYDIVGSECEFDEKFAARLGYRQVFVAGKDIVVADADREGPSHAAYIAKGGNVSRLVYHVKNGARGVITEDFNLEAKLLEAMAACGCVAVICTDRIIGAAAESRSRMLYKASRMFSNARKCDVNIALVSMARSRAYMESYMQLVELGKLIGADDRYARHMISGVNGFLVGVHD